MHFEVRRRREKRGFQEEQRRSEFLVSFQPPLRYKDRILTCHHVDLLKGLLVLLLSHVLDFEVVWEVKTNGFRSKHFWTP